jgi:hypothetical protein
VVSIADRTPVEVEWEVPLVRLVLFIPYWFMDGMIENWTRW